MGTKPNGVCRNFCLSLWTCFNPLLLVDEKWAQHWGISCGVKCWASRDCVVVSKEFSIKKNRTSKLKQLLLMLLMSPLCVIEVLGWEVGTHQKLTESQSYTWWMWIAGVCISPALLVQTESRHRGCCCRKAVQSRQQVVHCWMFIPPLIMPFAASLYNLLLCAFQLA